MPGSGPFKAVVEDQDVAVHFIDDQESVLSCIFWQLPVPARIGGPFLVIAGGTLNEIQHYRIPFSKFVGRNGGQGHGIHIILFPAMNDIHRRIGINDGIASLAKNGGLGTHCHE